MISKRKKSVSEKISIKTIDTDFSKVRLGLEHDITLNDLEKFHGHLCDGLVVGFQGLNEAFKVLYPDGKIDRTNTRIVSKLSPCLTDAAVYFAGGRYQFNTFYVSKNIEGLHVVQRIDNQKAVGVNLSKGVKPDETDRLGSLAVKGELGSCDLDKLKKMEDDFSEFLLNNNPSENFMNFNTKHSIIGSTIAFTVATSCCWPPALIIAIGGGSTLLGISNGLKEFSGLLMVIGIGLLGFGIYQFKKRKNRSMNKEVVLQSTITCPECGHKKEETMPTNACQYFYECDNCKKVLTPTGNDCCVYCSYGTVVCPPIQLNQNCCLKMKVKIKSFCQTLEQEFKLIPEQRKRKSKANRERYAICLF